MTIMRFLLSFVIGLALSSLAMCDAFASLPPLQGKLASSNRISKAIGSSFAHLKKITRKEMTLSDDSAILAQEKISASVDSGSVPPYTLSKQQLLYVVLNSLFVTCLIVADVIGVKLFEFKLPVTILGHSSVEHTCGMLTFPVTFLLGDIINEYYVSSNENYEE